MRQWIVGSAASLYYRNIDQSNPSVQLKMLRARDRLLGTRYVSRDLSPTTVWLTAFADYVTEVAPGDITADGLVKQVNFYYHLLPFLEVEVCKLSQSAYCELSLRAVTILLLRQFKCAVKCFNLKKVTCLNWDSRHQSITPVRTSPALQRLLRCSKAGYDVAM
jgi:hypothetical protein